MTNEKDKDIKIKAPVVTPDGYTAIETVEFHQHEPNKDQEYIPLKTVEFHQKKKN